MDGSISFDSNSLQTFSATTRTGIITDTIDADSPGTKNLSIYALANANNSAIPGGETPSKTINISGTVVSDTPANLAVLLDTFRGYFNSYKKNLDIGYNGAIRRYTATPTEPVITLSANKKYASFTMSFICTPPYGTDTTTTTALSATGRTSSSYTDSHTFVGSAPGQLPIITITLTAVSSTGSQQLLWGNGDTGQTIALTRTSWTTGDVIIIDCRNGGSVTVNGSPSDFSGVFPEFTKGAHSMVYSDTFTSRTFGIGVVYYARYK